MLQVLQIIDPQGQIFEQITLPVKSYLLRRNDTLRCIISHLTEDGDIHLKKPKTYKVKSIKEIDDEASSGSDDLKEQRWEVAASKETKTKKLVKFENVDLVTVLVNLYGSQEAFINEYQSMLAEKLMGAKKFNID